MFNIIIALSDKYNYFDPRINVVLVLKIEMVKILYH